MSEIKKWEYNTALCRWIKTSGGFFEEFKGYWVIEMGKEMPLQEGLNHAGDLGYELVGMQIAKNLYGGEITGADHPDYIYVFKRPRTEQKEDEVK